ncbi:hypothetical protein EQ871_17145 [Enterococcus casseliflavus]|uniref:hypothetical protein n=1 Tax=Enterococcus casseliflavus TaxID=37734 RepID=UPI000FFC0579|nr:hypothetical protein [Enterococcus casseliflavus]RXA58290.1 hypothetical protein EQ871_17145 [Enterococcus casseliflavus]
MFRTSKLLVLVASLVLVLAPSISWGANASAAELTTEDPIEYYKKIRNIPTFLTKVMKRL